MYVFIILYSLYIAYYYCYFFYLGRYIPEEGKISEEN